MTNMISPLGAVSATVGWTQRGGTGVVNGRLDVAIDHVERALDLGFLHKEWYLTDSDLANIKELPRSRKLIEEKFGQS